MNAGALNARVRLQQQVKVSDGMGGSKVGWADVDTLWASVVPWGSARAVKEDFIQQHVDASVVFIVTIRYRVGVLASMRLMYGTKPLQIVGSPRDVDSAHVWLELQCAHVEVP